MREAFPSPTSPPIYGRGITAGFDRVEAGSLAIGSRDEG